MIFCYFTLANKCSGLVMISFNNIDGLIILQTKYMQASNQLQSNTHPRLHVDVGPHNNKDIDTRWVQIKFGQSFSPRSYFASCIQAGNVYIHGGFNSEAGILKDMYTSCLYDLPVKWSPLIGKSPKQCSPGPLRNHTLSSYSSNLILIGGQKNVVQSNESIYRYDLLVNKWSICKCLNDKGKPFNLALDSHTAIVYKNNLYILGGYDANSTNYLNRIISINLDNIKDDVLGYQTINYGQIGPSPRANSSCCLVGGKIYVFGGGNVDDVFGDFWTWEIETRKWEQIKSNDSGSQPEKRKGGTLVYHDKSNCLFLFGGIKKITKQQNDVMVYLISSNKWIKIHSNTNELYDPSPTLKDIAQSPTIIEQKRKKAKSSTTRGGFFKIGLQQTEQDESPPQMHNTHFQQIKKELANPNETFGGSKKKMSVVQQKKYKDFLSRKKKLLHNIEMGFDKLPNSSKKRSHSPTSQALIFSLNCMGEQPRGDKSTMNLPKVIYDAQKGHVIGKKPCARDGHAGLLHQECMIILGGDRHMVSFNDAYMFKLDKGVNLLPLYK